jgi:hypothetical protein
MSDARTYVSSVVEESLGLVKGHLDGHPLPQDFVDQASSIIRGGSLDDVGRPILEERMASVLASMREVALKEDGFFVRKARWPGAAPFAVCLTHDVDNISRPASHIWKTRSRFSFTDLVGGLLGIVPLYNNVQLIASREGKHGFRSSFYFMSSNYPLSDVRSVSDRIRGDGWDVGLHGDFGTHDSIEKMNEAVSRFATGLGFIPTGVRQHYLRFDFAKSWQVMERAGFSYDTTVGTNDRLGFKLGLASPFHPPDGSWVPMNLLEVPLVLMDTTLWGYLKRSEDDGLADSMKIVAEVEGVEGLMTLLWHQEAVRMRGGRLYWRLLQEFKSRGCFVGSGAEVARWWRARSVPVVRDGKLIRLGGDPPKDLVLRLDLAEGREPRVDSGSVEGQGRSRLVRPVGRGLRMEVA